MLKKYIIPNITVVSMSEYNILKSFDCSQTFEKHTGSSTCCPFNGLWCVKKQNRLDAWKNTVKTYSEQGRDYVFFTRGDMFDGCPYDYEELCKHHKQRQRD